VSSAFSRKEHEQHHQNTNDQEYSTSALTLCPWVVHRPDIEVDLQQLSRCALIDYDGGAGGGLHVPVKLLHSGQQRKVFSTDSDSETCRRRTAEELHAFHNACMSRLADHTIANKKVMVNAAINDILAPDSVASVRSL
jgi:hypothetical protein